MPSPGGDHRETGRVYRPLATEMAIHRADYKRNFRFGYNPTRVAPGDLDFVGSPSSAARGRVTRGDIATSPDCDTNDQTMTNPTPAKMVWTVGELLTRTHEFFARQGVAEARLSAELLLAHVLACSRLELYTRFERTVSPADIAAFRELVRRRRDKMPVAYLIGQAWFYSLEFEVSPAVLIPRPETETLVEQTIQLARQAPAQTQVRILELGVGSGCIAIALAKNFPTAQLTGTECSAAALDLAAKNARRHGVVERVRFLQGDLFAPLEALPPTPRFHITVSNPPYIPTAQLDTLMPEVSGYEPRIALDGGADGLAFYRRIAAEVPRWLEPDGVVLVETAFDQTPAVERIFSQTRWYAATRIIADAAGHPRCVLARRGPDCPPNR